MATPQIVVSAATRAELSKVKAAFHLYGTVARESRLQAWLEPYDAECSTEFTEWLDEHAIPYKTG